MDVKKELRKIKFFDIIPNLKNLTARERHALKLCIEAAKILDGIYARQVCGDKLKEYHKIIEKSKDKAHVKRFFKINAGPWSRFHDDASFLNGVGKKPRGVSFYPKDLTVSEWKNYLKRNPHDRKKFESHVTVIRRKGGKLIAIPYNELFREELEKASSLLLKASKILKKGPLALYLKEISMALLTNNYRKSDIAWLKTNGFPFEIVFGPTEVYEDKFMGLKATFESFMGIPDKKMTQYVQSFKKYVPSFNKILSKKFGYSSKGSLDPMVVFSDVFRSGEAGAGKQLVAANLPNDREIHEKYGSKKVFSKIMMEAKSIHLASRASKKILSGEEAKHYNFNARFLFVLAHEIAHGMGPSMIKKGKKKISFEKLLGEFYPPLEEAKADPLGLSFIKFLISKGVLSKNLIKPILLSDVIGNIYSFRIGFTEAHNLAGLIEYNSLKNRKAIIYNKKQKTISVDIEKAASAYESLAYEIMKVQQKGSYEYAKEFVKKWSKIQPEITTLINKLKGIPLEVYPNFIHH